MQYHQLRSSTLSYIRKTHQYELQDSNPMAPTGKELYFLPFSVTAASSQTLRVLLYTRMYIYYPHKSFPID